MLQANHLSLRKSKVAHAFGKASHYDEYSSLQKHIAYHLSHNLPLAAAKKNYRALEIGCGTGHLTRYLAEHPSMSSIMATDISEAMLERCLKKMRGASKVTVSFEVRDGEHVANLEDFDLICSSMTLQWFENLAHTLNKYVECMSKGAIFAFSIPLEGSLKEWSEFAEGNHLPSGILAFPSKDTLVQALNRANLTNLIILEEEIHSTFTNPHAFLKSINQIGARVPHADYSGGRVGALHRVLRATQEIPFTCTWKILYVYACK